MRLYCTIEVAIFCAVDAGLLRHLGGAAGFETKAPSLGPQGGLGDDVAQQRIIAHLLFLTSALACRPSGSQPQKNLSCGLNQARSS